MKILTVVGARPQFIKAATVSRAIQRFNAESLARGGCCALHEVIVHTGQHFDSNMSGAFFQELDIPQPCCNLGISNQNHGAATGRMLEAVEERLLQERPDWMLVYGDTNSTLAGALAAVKQRIPIAHVEAGLRSQNPEMPEEINRVLTDRISSVLFCPTESAVENLRREGFPHIAQANIPQHVENVGDVMYDAVLSYRDSALRSISLSKWGLTERRYSLCTLHRQENTDNLDRLGSIFSALREIARDLPVVLPMHPRTRHRLHAEGVLDWIDGLTVLNPLPYLDIQRLQMGAQVILTDSGGVQKEAYFNGTPCVTLRDETEWVETVDAGWNYLAGTESSAIVEAARTRQQPKSEHGVGFGDGHAADAIVKRLAER